MTKLIFAFRNFARCLKAPRDKLPVNNTKRKISATQWDQITFTIELKNKFRNQATNDEVRKN